MLALSNLECLVTPSMTFLQSCNGFLLLKVVDGYSIYNPSTLERFTLPPLMSDRIKRRSYRDSLAVQSSLGTRVRMLELDHCQFHHAPFSNEIIQFSLAFNKSCDGRVIALTCGKEDYVYEIYVAEFGGEWRHSGLVFEYEDKLADGVYWNNSIIWLGRDLTVCFDVDGEELRGGASPPHTLNDSFYFGESNGHLHFIHWNKSGYLIINEMMIDLSSWFVKYSISCGQIDPPLLVSSNDFSYRARPKIICLTESDNDASAVMVLGVRGDIISYRIQDGKSTKICKLEVFGGSTMIYRKPSTICQHIESIFQFHSSSFSNFI